MKLIEYVIEKDSDVERIKVRAAHHEMKTKEYIVSGYCPSAFNLLNNTPYEKPYEAEKHDKSTCKYLSDENESKCIECWNREVPI